MKKLFLSLFLTLFASKIYPGLFSSYQTKSPEENVADLAIEQINNPTDPYINYNLGVALYKTEKYEEAQNNFDRAILHTKSPLLKERSYFNLGNSCYQNARTSLPVDWENEKTKIDQSALGKAIEEAKTSIKNYENFLELNKEDKRAKINLKKAKELLEKLQKKQQQQNQDKNKDQDKKDQDKKQDQQKQDQQKQDQKQQDQQDKEHQKKDQDKSQDQQDQQKQDKQQQDQQNKDQQDQQKQESGQQVQQVPVTNTKEKEPAEKKEMRLMLENLQNEEDNLQKEIMQRQTKDQKPLESSQKPW